MRSARKFTLLILLFACIVCIMVEAKSTPALRQIDDYEEYESEGHSGGEEKHEEHEEHEEEEEEEEEHEEEEEEEHEEEEEEYEYEEEEEEEEEPAETEEEEEEMEEHSYKVECSSIDEEILFAHLEFTPCSELIDQVADCQHGCTLTNFQTEACIEYTTEHPERVYECIPKSEESLLQLPTIHFNPFMRFFSLAIDTCIESATGLTLNEVLVQSLESSARYFGEYVPPSIMEKNLYQQIGEDLWKKNWQQVYIVAKQLGMRPCRYEHNNYDIFMLLPPENAARYSGPVMAFRVDSPSQVILHASRHNLRLDNMNYMMEIFANSDVQALVFQPYSPLSSLEKDFCQPHMRITEGTHSMETPIFHLLKGLADAFPVSVFVESEECNRCVGVIGRGMEVDMAGDDNLITHFINDANDLFNPLRDRADHDKNWYVDLAESQLVDNIFRPSEAALNGYHSIYSVLGRYLHKVHDICDVEGEPVVTDNNRYISLQREARSLQEVDSGLSWESLVKLLDKLADGKFMEERMSEYGREQNGEGGGYPSPVFSN